MLYLRTVSEKLQGKNSKKLKPYIRHDYVNAVYAVFKLEFPRKRLDLLFENWINSYSVSCCAYDRGVNSP